MRKECPNKSENEKNCPCDEIYCNQHGICCECILYHRKSGGKPACIRK